MAPNSFRSLSLAVLLVVVLSTMQLPSLGAASSGSHDLLMLDRFHRWMSAHGRSYRSTTEKLRRLEVYRRNVEFIDASNRDAQTLGYELGENEFTDLTNEEFVAMYAHGGTPPPLAEDDHAVGHDDGMVIITTLTGNVREGHGSNAVPPLSFDWRAQGAVTPPKMQGTICGACWAFTAVGTVESLIKIKGGALLDLSEQELIDCDRAQMNCSGGWANKALEWIQAKGGLVAEALYPYNAAGGACRDMTSAARAGKITGVKQVSRLNELALQLAVMETPVSASMDASGDVLQFYKSGVYNGPCKTVTNHAVVLVGWGVDAAGVKYWIAKNSWGPVWGQSGFFFMRREVAGVFGPGLCGLATGAYYPVM